MATTCLENCQSFCLTLDADVETCNVNCAERLCPAEEAVAEVAPEPTPVPAVEVAENNNDFIYGFIVFLMCLFAFTIVVAVTHCTRKERRLSTTGMQFAWSSAR